MITGGGKEVMPFYLVCDVSWSMRDELDTLRNGIGLISRQIRYDAILSDAARVGVITFADTANVPMRLGRLGDGRVPDITCAGPGPTNYGAAFEKLADEWERDCGRLTDEGLGSYRPCAYFLTAGEPSDLNWEYTLEQKFNSAGLSQWGVPRYPILAPFGFRDATESTLQRLAYPRGESRWYHAKSASFTDALTGLLGIIMNSLVSTGNTLRGGQFGHILPHSNDPDISSGTAA